MLSAGAAFNSVTAAGAELTALKMGFNGIGKVERWLPLYADAAGLPAGEEVALQAAFSDPSGDICVEIVDRRIVADDGSAAFEGCFRIGRLEGHGVISIVGTKSGPIIEVNVDHGRSVVPADPPNAVQTQLTIRRLDTRTLLTLGTPSGIEELLRNARAYAAEGQVLLDGVQLQSIRQLPEDTRSLDCVDLILLTDQFDASGAQTEALKGWVRSGGRLVVSAAMDVKAFLATDPGRWIGPMFDIESNPTTIRDLTSMQSYVSGASRLETNRQYWPMSVMKSDQVAKVVDSLKGPLIGMRSYGGGVLTFVALDVNKKPVSQWKSLPQFYELLLLGSELSSRGAGAVRTSRISQSGVSDLATQMLSTVDAVPEYGGWSTWAIMAMIAGYLLLIGPVDYLLVTRLLGKPHLTWITFPLMILAGVLILTAGNVGSSKPVLNELHVVDIYADDQQQLKTRSWMSLVTPQTMRTQLTADPSRRFTGTTDCTASLSWSGRPEDVYGGMYRTAGIGLGSQQYVHDQQQQQSLSTVPLLINGSRGLYSEWTAVPENPVVESYLAASGYGLLTGTFHHNLSESVRDWIIVHGNRIYRAAPDSELSVLDPGEQCDADATDIYASDLKAFLNGARIVPGTGGFGRSNRGSTQVVTAYDRQSRDQQHIVTMTSFFAMAGGRKYVGLSQTLLRDMEVSDTIRLNHGILLGTVDSAATTLAMDGEHIQPTATRTIVRMFLPVDRRPAKDLARLKEDIDKEADNDEEGDR